VGKALEALHITDKLRVENYQTNRYEFNTTGTQLRQDDPVSLLDYVDASKNASLAKLRKRQSANECHPVYGYFLSPGIVRAAKDVEETEPPTSWDVDYAAIAARMRAKYTLRNNDTNAMTQMLHQKDGLPEYTSFDQPRGLQEPLQENQVKRATSS
jgi:hypothetical protein